MTELVLQDTERYLDHIAKWFMGLYVVPASTGFKNTVAEVVDRINVLKDTAVAEQIREIPAIPEYIPAYIPRDLNVMASAWASAFGVTLKADQDDNGEVVVIHDIPKLLALLGDGKDRELESWFTETDRMNSLALVWVDIDGRFRYHIYPAIAGLSRRGEDTSYRRYGLRTRSERKVWLIFKHSVPRFTLVHEGVTFTIPVSVRELPKSFPDDILIPPSPFAPGDEP